jgi:hypothetical protein
MGDRSRFSSSSGLRFLLRLASLVAALLVLSTSGRAAAMTAVPMCGERAESIAAPPIFRAHDDGTIVAAPCHVEQLEAGRSAPPAPERVVVQERPERVLGFSALCLAQTRSLRLSIASASQALERPGFVDSLFRPPRA